MTLQIKKIILAPMEGVIDSVMRELLTSINQYDLCITEFIRVVDSLVPKHKYYKICPELADQGRTPNGTKVRVQLLGQNPDYLAENALRAIELGSNGVDLNFGCPAKTVNKNKGGAYLLDDPELIYQIINSVKSTVGNQNIVSAKIRLGFNDTNRFNELLDAIAQTKVDMLTIHARTKKDGYKAPAYWDFITKAQKKLNIDIVANGEIWSSLDALKCIDVSKTNSLMLGRGALALPNLANVIRSDNQPMTISELKELLLQFYILSPKLGHSFYFSSRLKQWLRYLKNQYPAAENLFEQIKKIDNHQLIIEKIKQLN